jgi:MSHA pilin protein MshC
MRANRCQSGFTLTELVVVLVIVGTLAIVALPRFFDVGIYQQRGFYDELVSALRYAHKHAIATGCHVRVRITSTGYDLLRAPGLAGCKGALGALSAPVANPGGGSFSGSAPSGVALSATDFFFDGQGRVPAAIPGFILVSANSRQVRVYGETGFVQEL